MTTYLIVTLDTECDRTEGWWIKRPFAFENILEGIPDRLQPLFNRYAIKPTYLLSPEVIKDEASSDFFGSMGGKAELGTHLHGEFIAPEDSPEANLAASFQSDFMPEVEKAKLRNLTDLFTAKFGYKPSSFRAGRYGISRHSLDFLDQLGYLVDSSVTPYLWWRRNLDVGVNFLGALTQPYHPSSSDFRKAGDLSILEVPISVRDPFWEKFPKPIIRKLNPLKRYQIIALNLLFGKKMAPKWIRPTFSTTEEMLYVADYYCQKSNGPDVFLCMMFHSMEATAGLSPYNTTAEDIENFLDRMDGFFEELGNRYHVEPIGLSEVIKFV